MTSVINNFISKISDKIHKYPLINQIIFMLKLLRYLNIKPNQRIAILGKNSNGWIVTFWTAIFGKMPVVIIDIDESMWRIVDILNKHCVQILFVDKDIYKDKFNKSNLNSLFHTYLIFSIPSFSKIDFKIELLHSNIKQKLSSINFDDWITFFTKMTMLNRLSMLNRDNFEDRFKINLLVENVVENTEFSLYKRILELNKEDVFDDEDICIISFSPGVTESNTYINGRKMTMNDFEESMNRFIIKYKTIYLDAPIEGEIKMSTFVKFSLWFPFLVGVSFLQRTDLIYPNSKYEKRLWVYDTVTFEKMWNEEIETILQKPFYRNLYLTLPFLYRMHIKKRFYQIFGKDVKEVTILNCQVRDNIMYHLNKCNLPISVTAGTVANNYISAIARNNIYSPKFLESIHIFRKHEVSNEDRLIRSLDLRTVEYKTINLENFERVIKALPFVTNCIVVKHNKLLHAFIELNQNIYDVSTLEDQKNNVILFTKLKEKLNKLLYKRIGVVINHFSFINNLLVDENGTNGYFPKALNGMPKLSHYLRQFSS